MKYINNNALYGNCLMSIFVYSCAQDIGSTFNVCDGTIKKFKNNIQNLSKKGAKT